MDVNNLSRRLPAEWEAQAAIMIAWPHPDTDWNYMLGEVEECYERVVEAISQCQPVVVVTPNPSALSYLQRENIIVVKATTNDTWARDFGPISVSEGGQAALLDFKFNAWGMKFAANHDNLVNRALYRQGVFQCKLYNCQDFVLEGGSIESDGQGTLMTTSSCLLSANRNGHLSRTEIESYLAENLGVHNFIWLDHGYLEGDDTDSHIDTLARFCPGGVIAYVGSTGADAAHREQLMLMEAQLRCATDMQGNPYRLAELPFVAPIYDENGQRLPATYANFLITNQQVLVPTYGQPDTDQEALRIIGELFPGRKAIGIDCRALIKQHGSLHCITMQLLEGAF